MFSRQVKKGVFVVEALNAFATTFYFFYFYFFTQEKFGFDRLHNLLLAASFGLVYVPASIFGGRFAQRHGYFRALRIGFTVMAAALFCGCFLNQLWPHLAVAMTCNVAMCFTWPTLEGMVSENEPPRRLQKMLGIYNLVWAAGGATAYFVAGALIERFGLRILFVVPATIHLVNLGLTLFLEKKSGRSPAIRPVDGPEKSTVSSPSGLLRSPVSPETFLKMAWLANPFAYLAVNTVIAVIPSMARHLGLSPRYVGFFCSIWLFVRAASFAALWQWPGWHYRFRWLATAYAAMVAGFTTILLAPNLAVLIAAQLAFGLALGLIYYSSLYYSMDVGETKGEHGGFHEAAIGAGNFAGPAIGATALAFFPGHENSSAWAVSGCLLLGLVGLVWLRWKPQPPPAVN